MAQPHPIFQAALAGFVPPPRRETPLTTSEQAQIIALASQCVMATADLQNARAAYDALRAAAWKANPLFSEDARWLRDTAGERRAMDDAQREIEAVRRQIDAVIADAATRRRGQLAPLAAE